MKTLRFDRRYRGFESGALGGYVAGAMVDGRIDGPAEVNLRSLPPMDRDLELKADGEGAVDLFHGETLVAEAKPRSLELDVPAPLSLDEAEEANERLLHDETEHLYPGCFTCGPAREEGDGLRLFMGAPDRDGLIAAAWTPHPDLAAEDERLPTEMVWAALDCPSIWAAGGFQEGVREGFFMVLARQRVERLAPVPVGMPAIVSSWPIERDGRKRLTGAAIHDADGSLLARCEALLVEVPIPKA